ncbi:N-acetylmuramoyl-L-alanine amidase [Clostridium oceanicum]|uniref:MurNAc-LAA domain-containing protein n=1 Tax=Clostridium oceanicum TaxID=1543 RepID=A0ABN1JET8_9CLOT
MKPKKHQGKKDFKYSKKYLDYKRQKKNKYLKKKRVIKKLKLRLFLLIIIVLFSGFMGKKLLNMYKDFTTPIPNESVTTTKNFSKYSKFTVTIDPGHGGYDVGTSTIDGMMHEKEITLKIGLEVKRLLEEKGVNVIMTRTSDNVSWPSNNKKDLRARVKISNDSNSDAFVSIHCNANENTAHNGMEGWIRFPNTQSEKLAKNIINKLSSYNYTKNRGIKNESIKSLAVLTLNNSTATLIELGFLSNSSDAKFLTSKEGQAKSAKGISEGVLEYLSNKD